MIVHHNYLLLIFFTLSSHVLATTYTISSLADAGPGTLRQVITDASSGDTIVFVDALPGPVLLDSQIVANRDLVIIGAIAATTIIDASNSAERILNIAANWEISNITFRNGGNQAQLGGAIISNTSLKLVNCIFDHNTASQGGAIYTNGGDLAIEQCVFKNDSVVNNGGAIEANGNKVKIINSIFYNNNAAVGRDIYNNATHFKMINCTLYNNFSGKSLYSESNSPEITNSIFWSTNNNEKEIIHNPTATEPLVTHSIIKGGYTGIGNINQDPLFVDTTNIDLQLKRGSPAINSGNNASIPADILIDLDNVARIVNNTVDMGAYESHCPVPGIPILVDVDATGDNIGETWADAKIKLQDAIDLACRCGSNSGYAEIWIAEGIYYPTKGFDGDRSGGTNPREKTFYIHTNIQIYGGFTGNETLLGQREWDTHKVILSGDIGVAMDSLDNAYHVMYIDGTTAKGNIDSTCRVDGVIIRDGVANESPNNSGGGMYLNGSLGKICSPTIIHCTVYNNSSKSQGAGIYNEGAHGTCSPRITHCSFSNNSAYNFGGGGICNNGFDGDSSPRITHCSFSNNYAINPGNYSFGGAIRNRGEYGNSSPQISDCSFFYNSAGTFGGAIHNDGTRGNSSPQITNCSFLLNSAFSGGGIYNDGLFGTCSPQITNCSFLSSSVSRGGGIYNSGRNGNCFSKITNCIFADNSAFSGGGIYNDGFFGTCSPQISSCTFLNNSTENGGGIYNYGYGGTCTPLITNCSFFKNTSTVERGAIYNYSCGGSPQISNCILWNNGTEINNHLTSPIVNYSIVEGGYAGIGNQDQDPLFVDTINGDLRLMPYSPAVNSGNNANVPAANALDLADTSRIIDGTVDMGAYEFPEGDCPKSPILNTRYSPLHGTYQASESITVQGEVTTHLDGAELDAPMVDLNGMFKTPLSYTFLASQMGCQ